MKANQLAFHPFGVLSYNFRIKLDGKETHDEAFCYMIYCDEDYVIAMTWDDDHKCEFHLLDNNDVAFRPAVNDDMVQVETICSRANNGGVFDIEGIDVFLLLEVTSKIGVFRVGLLHDDDKVKLLSMPLIENQQEDA